MQEIKIHNMPRKQAGFATPSITVPAIAYCSGSRIWYAITLPYGALKGGIVRTSSVRKKGEEIIKSEIKNRFLDKNHKNEIKEYMKVEERFTIPPVTLVSTELLPFEPIIFGDASDIMIKDIDDLYNLLKKVGSLGGVIQIPLDYQFECLDGNHRTVAIKELAEEMPEIIQGSNLLLNIVCENDLLKIRQDFVDVNKNAKQTTPSINTLFNTRDPLPNIVSKMLSKVNYLENITDLISTSISKNSNDIYTLNNIKNAVIEISGFDSQGAKISEEKTNKYLSDSNIKDNVEIKTKMFFDSLKNNKFIKACLEDRSKTIEIKSQSIITLGVGLVIAAHVANIIFEKFEPSEYNTQLNKLANYDWSRVNPIFKEAGIVTTDGKVLNSRSSVSKAKEFVLIDLCIEKN